MSGASPPWRFAAAHRRRFADHRDARESDAPGQLLEYFRGTDELEAGAGAVTEAEVVNVPEASRYELRLGGRRACPRPGGSGALRAVTGMAKALTIAGQGGSPALF